MFWRTVEKAGILGGLISLILLLKQYLWPYLLRLYYYPKMERFLKILFNPGTIKVGETTRACISFPLWKKRTEDDLWLQLKEKYKLVLKKISFHFPIGLSALPISKGWSFPDVRKKGYVTFDYFPIDPRLKQPEALQPGTLLGLGEVQLQKVEKPGEYKIPASIEVLLETKIGHVGLTIQKGSVIKIFTV